MASNPDEVRRAAMAELARRELARRQKPADNFSGRYFYPTPEAGKALGENALAFATGAASQIPAGLAGIGAAVIPGGEPAADTVKNVEAALTYQPKTEAGQMLQRDITSKPMQLADRGADIAGDVLGGSSPLAETVIKTSLLALPMLLGRGAPKLAEVRPPVKPPTTAALKEQATKAYQAADDSGVILSGKSMGNAVERIVDRVADEGIDATLHPDSMAALSRLMDASGKNHSLKGADILRQIIKDAENSTRPADRRMAGIMRREFDKYMEGLGPEDVIAGDAKAATQALSEARNLYARNRKSETIENLMKRAEIRASQFSGSGRENALRTEFRQLAMNEKKMSRFTPEEQAAIRKVAQGGPIDNVLRMLGKMAPTGIVSGALTSGAGAMMAGPLGAVGLPMVGGLARRGAEAMTGRNVQLASELMRRGGPEAKIPARGTKQMAIAAALADQQN